MRAVDLELAFLEKVIFAPEPNRQVTAKSVFKLKWFAGLNPNRLIVGEYGLALDCKGPRGSRRNFCYHPRRQSRWMDTDSRCNERSLGRYSRQEYL